MRQASPARFWTPTGRWLALAGAGGARGGPARLAGRSAAGVLCEVLDTDGSMARLPRLEAFARAHDLKIITIADLIDYRRRREKLIRRDIFKPRLVPT